MERHKFFIKDSYAVFVTPSAMRVFNERKAREGLRPVHLTGIQLMLHPHAADVINYLCAWLPVYYGEFHGEIVEQVKVANTPSIFDDMYEIQLVANMFHGEP